MIPTPEITARLEKLEQKYAAMGQDMLSYLDGLLHADFLTYWDYIHLDTLMSLQNPRTSFPDEKIFIIYHQITELYLQLMLHECGQITGSAKPALPEFTEKLKRINRYVEHLIHSFDVMVDGMDKEQFLNFRMSLLPASGFQSGQFRLLEIYSTDLIRLVYDHDQERLQNAGPEEMYAHIYWKKGATELSSGQKTLTLKQFENKYSGRFIGLAKAVRDSNLWQQYLRLPGSAEERQIAAAELRAYDQNLNLRWKLSHYRSAARYLHKDPEALRATGGTNWQKYLPPRFQKCIFYPELFSEEERKEWGKSWVMENIL